MQRNHIRGEDTTVQTADFETALGTLRIRCTSDAVTGLIFTDDPPVYHGDSVLAEETAAQVTAYLRGERRTLSVPAAVLSGTPFQRRCWEAAQQIPFGETRSYGEIAAMTGNPCAARAVGAALHANPLWLLIPCHRVIGAHGKLTGYAGGIARKSALLRLERTGHLF